MTASRFCQLVIILLPLNVCSLVQAVDVEETIWGYDGRVVPYRFNPLSLLISNNSEESINLRLELRRSARAGSDRLGAKMEEAVFLSPFSSRWVQFYPYIASENDAWSVSWGFLRSQKIDLPSPNIGGLARVALIDSGQMTNRKGEVKSFPEELFPPFASATNTLEAIHLDHNPRWQEPRRGSLLQWVQRGGMLLVTPNSSGEYPEFTEQLAIFNSPLPELQVGQGLVLRSKSRTAAIKSTNKRLGEPFVALISEYNWNLGENIFHKLKSISTPRHNWWVINIMSIIYIALVFPGWFLLARGNPNYRTTILAFVGVAAVFTIAFNLVGRRGYDESTTINTMAIARKIDKDQYDVLSWTNVFVTGGDKYELKFDGAGHLYSTGALAERVAGFIDNGLEGTFIADIPLFSSRAFMHRGIAKGPEWTVSTIDEDHEANAPFERMKFQISPQPSERSAVYAVARNRFYPLTKEGAYYRAKSSYRPIDASFVPDEFFEGTRYPFRNRAPQRPSAARVYGQLGYPVIARELGTHIRPKNLTTTLPSDVLRFFIRDKLPESFAVKNPKLVGSDGVVLYSLDLRVPSGTTALLETESKPSSDVDSVAIEDGGLVEENTGVEAEETEPNELDIDEDNDDE